MKIGGVLTSRMATSPIFICAAWPSRFWRLEGHTAGLSHSNLFNKLKRMSSGSSGFWRELQWGPNSPLLLLYLLSWSRKWVNTKKGSPRAPSYPSSTPAGTGLTQFFGHGEPTPGEGTMTLPTSLADMGGGGFDYGGPLPLSYSTPWGISLH